jgi:hemerythrin
MEKLGYPAATAHRKEHAKFARSIAVIRREFDEIGPAPAIIARVQRCVCDWLVEHVGKFDRELGAFLKGKV